MSCTVCAWCACKARTQCQCRTVRRHNVCHVASIANAASPPRNPMVTKRKAMLGATKLMAQANVMSSEPAAPTARHPKRRSSAGSTGPANSQHNASDVVRPISMRPFQTRRTWSTCWATHLQLVWGVDLCCFILNCVWQNILANAHSRTSVMGRIECEAEIC